MIVSNTPILMRSWSLVKLNSEIVPAGQVGVRPCDGMSGIQYCSGKTPLNAGDFSCCSTSSNLFSIAAAISGIATVSGQRAIIRSPLTTMTSPSMSMRTTSSSTSTKSNESPTVGCYGSVPKGGNPSNGLSQGAKIE